jgi:hypothetical protein
VIPAVWTGAPGGRDQLHTRTQLVGVEDLLGDGGDSVRGTEGPDAVFVGHQRPRHDREAAGGDRATHSVAPLGKNS